MLKTERHITLRKSIVVLALLSFVFSFAVVSVGAQATPSTAALADNLPAENALVYASIRTDDAFIDDLDALFAPFYPYAEDLPPNFDIRMGINMALAEAELSGDFETAIRPWLGDTIAVAAYIDDGSYEDTEFLYAEDVFDEMEAIIAVDIADRAAAEKFINSVFAAQDANVEAQQRSGYTVYEVPFGPVIALDDDKMFFAEEIMFDRYNLLSGDYATISGSADFADTLNEMPVSTYSGIGYVSMPTILSVLETVAETTDDEFAQEEAAEQLTLLNTFEIGSIAMGFTGLANNTIATDILVVNGAGYLNQAELGAISPEFAARIPASTPFVIHGTNIDGALDAALDTIEQTAPDSDDVEELAEGLEEVDEVLMAETGLVLEDIVGWMVNDYALVLTLSDSALNASSIFGLIGANPLDLGLLIDATADPAAAVAVVDAIEEVASGELAAAVTEGEEAEVDLELTREADILTLSIRDNTGNVPFPIELQVGVADEVFFVGTPGLATSIVAGDGGLGSTANYTEASSLMFPGTVSAYYIDVDNLMPLVDLAENFAEEESDLEDINTLREILSLFNHLTISQAIDENGNSTGRATITLAN